MTVSIGPDDDEDEGELQYNDDGSITVRGEKKAKASKGSKNFNANLAESLDESELDVLASDLLEAIEDDIRSRKDWEDTFNRGLDLLGLKIEEATSAVTSGGSNISKVKDPILLEACLTYQSNFNAEMLPADGPVKVRDDKVQVYGSPPVAGAPGGVENPVVNGAPAIGHNGGPPLEDTAAPGMAMGGVPPQPGPPSPGPMGGPPPPMNGAPHPPMGGMAPPPSMPAPVSRDELANAFGIDFNHYLTVVDRPYYPDTDRMSFSQALGGCAFKKIYVDPIEERPISRFVMAQHLVVNNGASSLHDAKRITHWIPKMTPLVMRQMMDCGAYRDIELTTPTSQPGTVDTKIAEMEGRTPRVDRPDDADYNVYECYCYKNLKGFEEKKNLPVPYRVTIEKDSRKVLEIRRDWKQGDKTYKRKRHFVKYPMFPGLGFYDYGFVHLLGNTARVLSAIESLMVDSGIFANFPGGFIDRAATARQDTNQFRPGPGGFKPVETGGRRIQDILMSTPYKDVSPNLMQLATGIAGNARKLASIAELPIAEGRADVPVGTVLALIEQQKVMESAVHRRNLVAQHEEFEILKELFAENPQALVKLARNPARQWEVAEEFEDFNLVPMADPNSSSKTLRIGKATALLQILQQSPPGLLNPKEILTRAFREMQLENIDALFMPPPPPGSQPPPPHVVDAQAKAAQLQQKSQSDAVNAQVKLKIAQMASADKQQANQTNLQLEQEKLQIEAMKHVAEIQQGTTPNTVPPPSGMGTA